MKFKYINILFCILVLQLCFVNASTRPDRNSLLQSISHGFEVAKSQSMYMCNALKDSAERLPRTADKNEHLLTSDSKWWCSGFFPGVLWYIYQYTGDTQFRKQADLFTWRIEQEKNSVDNQDIGFMLYNSFGNGYRLTGDTRYKNVLEVACKSLSSRYNSKIKSIRSWDFNKNIWEFPVIIDNMMNLEMLIWGSKAYKNDFYREVAVNHANTTMLNHFRSDYSSFHVVSYDTVTYKPHVKQTFQGAADGSAWARGQGWGLYGFTFMYRETKDVLYLNQARHIAQFIINHPNLPSDKIPYWDFNAPNIPNEERDASAGALIASALLELSQFVNGKEREEYINVAEIQIQSLCSERYLAIPGTNGYFILKHSVGFKGQKNLPPYFGEIDVPLTYADYYFVEALTKCRKLIESRNKNYELIKRRY